MMGDNDVLEALRSLKSAIATYGQWRAALISPVRWEEIDEAIDEVLVAARAGERAAVREHLGPVLCFAAKYAEGGGSNGPEVREYNEAMRALGWEVLP